MKKPKTMQRYALYKGDTYIMEGNLQQIAKFKGIKFESAYYYTMPAYTRRTTRRGAEEGNVTRLVSLDDENEEDNNAQTH